MMEYFFPLILFFFLLLVVSRSSVLAFFYNINSPYIHSSLKHILYVLQHEFLLLSRFYISWRAAGLTLDISLDGPFSYILIVHVTHELCLDRPPISTTVKRFDGLRYALSGERMTVALTLQLWRRRVRRGRALSTDVPQQSGETRKFLHRGAPEDDGASCIS